MDPKLIEAFRMLEAKPLEDKRYPRQKYTPEIWQTVDQQRPGLGPEWYRKLTQDFSVAGAYFLHPVTSNRGYTNTNYCEILVPAGTLYYLEDDYALLELYNRGFFWFADAENGNFWVFPNDAVDDPPVYFFDLSYWDGDLVSTDNGLYPLNVTLSEFFKYGSTAVWPKD